MPTWTNWGRSVSAEVAEIAQPRSIDELQQVVVGAAARGLRLKAVGAGHSFNGVGLTDGVQVRLDRFTGVDRVDLDSGLVTIRAGTSLHDLNEALWQVGLALTNLGDVDVQTIAGAISTGTHGTGACFAGLASQVRGLQLVCADGTLLTCSPDAEPDVFAAAQVGLGALGVIGTVTLQCEPAYALAAAEAPMPLDGVLARPGRAGRHQRPLRVLLVPAYPTGTDQAQQPGPRRHATPAPGSGPRLRSTTNCWRTRCSAGSTG